jgi:hypothetical protein
MEQCANSLARRLHPGSILPRRVRLISILRQNAACAPPTPSRLHNPALQGALYSAVRFTAPVITRIEKMRSIRLVSRFLIESKIEMRRGCYTVFQQPNDWNENLLKQHDFTSNLINRGTDEWMAILKKSVIGLRFLG